MGESNIQKQNCSTIDGGISFKKSVLVTHFVREETTKVCLVDLLLQQNLSSLNLS